MGGRLLFSEPWKRLIKLLHVGTEDLKTLSAVYSQLGNAYFYLNEYEKALEFHRHDLTLARTLGDRLGEAKASGNLGNTLKVLGKFDEAIFCCTIHLDTSRELKNKVSPHSTSILHFPLIFYGC